MNKFRHSLRQGFSRLTLVAGAALFALAAPGVRAACAKVVIQIEQELTLEREGFEARLGVTNSLPAALENFQVTLKFTDADGNPVGAYTTGSGASTDRFFYRPQTGYTVPTTIAAGAERKVAYLIVPTPGAAGTTALGALYYVGATIKYTVAGEEQVVEVAPDYITVRPMPLLQLQYFLPGNVYGDDPHTPDTIESLVPFALGVRVSNHSPFATAKQVGILSGQPKIVENELGLLIDFRIVGSEVNGHAAQPTLQVNFGNIAPRRAGVANWVMTSTLSGSFTQFSAEVEHAPEFGGALTSLIPEDAITTHRLIGRVLVDQAGRDAVPDFLGADSMTGTYTGVKLYESDNDEISAPVDYFAPGAPEVALDPTADPKIFTLAVTAASAALYVHVASPIAADQTVRAMRSDGKPLPATNTWVSKTRDGAGPWQYWVNLFDTDKGSQGYSLTFSNPAQVNQAPVLALPGGLVYEVLPGHALAIAVSASDPDGLIPVLSTGLLPDGAAFTDTTNGTGTLTWTPLVGQLGNYAVQFRAFDGIATTTKSVQVRVVETLSGNYDSWTEEHWPGVTDPAIIGEEADPDGDGLANLLEYALDGDPTTPDDSILPQIGLETVGADSYLTLTYRKRTDDGTLLYEVVGTDSLETPLADWVVQSQTLPVNQDNLPDGRQRIKVRDGTSVTATSAPASRYLRLRVSRN